MSGARARRPIRIPLPRTVAGRRRLTAAVVLIAAAAAGYLTTCVLYPSPIFDRDHVVPRVIGQAISDAESSLTELGFKVKIAGEAADPDIPEGHVVWQDPPPDLVAPGGTIVQLTRSSGPAPVAVPDVARFDADQAARVIVAAGLKIGSVDSVPNEVDPGVVVATRPSAGTGRPPGTTIDLVVSRGPATIRVPNVVGLPLAEARQRLTDAGLATGQITRVKRAGPPDTVVEQRPGAGGLRAHGARIDLVVTEVN